MTADICCHITIIRRLILYVMLYNCYQTSDVRYPFLLNSALLFLIIVKMTIECERDQYIIENKRKQKKTKGYGLRATTMEDENAVTPTLCFAQVSLDRCSKHA